MNFERENFIYQELYYNYGNTSVKYMDVLKIQITIIMFYFIFFSSEATL